MEECYTHPVSESAKMYILMPHLVGLYDYML